ncbi:MAG: glycosyl hydrolase family 8 [Terricaulis sp.]
MGLRMLFRWIGMAAVALACIASPAYAQSNAERGAYRNLFHEWRADIDEPALDAKLNLYWASLFEGDAESRVFYWGEDNASGRTGHIVDINNDDVRSEGMSYGMMIAVQMNRKAEFDALWNWAATHMRYASGPRAGYFRWQCTRTGCPRDAVPASDGEEYFATALFFASHRWGDGEGVYDYSAHANAILDTMLHKEDMNGGVVEGVHNMFNREERQVVFVPVAPGASFSDPSYHLPAFYELWGRWAEGWQGQREQDRAFWLDAARTSRAFFDASTHPVTGLAPDYATFEGAPVHRGGHGDFRFDAFRTAVNWSVDYAWWGADANAPARSDRLQAFFAGQGMDAYANQFAIDGAPLSTDRSSGLIASNGVVSLAATHPRAQDFVAALWAIEPPRGRYRYYNGLLEFMALLHAGGRFQVYWPSGGVSEVTATE